MREEMKKQSAELNEAALENVSGGGVEFKDCHAKAIQLCRCCRACKKESDLIKYLLKGDNYYSVRYFDECPFYNQ